MGQPFSSGECSQIWCSVDEMMDARVCSTPNSLHCRHCHLAPFLFPQDYMHLLYLGVPRRLLFLWLHRSQLAKVLWRIATSSARFERVCLLRHIGGMLTRAGHKSDTAEAKAAKYRPSHSHRLTVISVVLCSVKKGLTQKLGVLCFVLINSVLDDFF